LAAIAEAGQVAAALIATAIASRAALVALMYRMKPARRGGLAADAGKPDQSQVLLTLLLGGAMALFFLNFLIPGVPGLMAGVIVLIIGSVGVFGIAYLARRAIGGYTGDVLGAAQQTMEIAMLLTIVAII
jgi:adenosylcobinamide-GDP ribazoletransferase